MLELILLGIVLIILGMFILMLSLWRASGEGRAEAGGVVIVGPVPIVFGTSQRIAATVMVLAIALTVVALLLFLLGSALVR